MPIASERFNSRRLVISRTNVFCLYCYHIYIFFPLGVIAALKVQDITHDYNVKQKSVFSVLHSLKLQKKETQVIPEMQKKSKWPLSQKKDYLSQNRQVTNKYISTPKSKNLLIANYLH